MRCPDCDPARRRFLARGVTAGLGLLLGPRLLAQEAAGTPAVGRTARRLIVLWMGGGMSQTDTFDPKPGTPQAGPLKAIPTAVPDLFLSELLPRLAEQARHLAVIRGMATREGAHERATYLLQTGYLPSTTVEHPALGALAASVLTDPALDLPAFVAVGQAPAGAGFLGEEVAPFAVADPDRPLTDLRYPAGVDAARFDRRRRLLEAVERRFRREHPGPEADGHRAVYIKADKLMHSPRLKAFDLAEESAALRDAYGRSAFGQGCLLARRLVEAGVPAVEVRLDGWDTHQDNFSRNRDLAARLDAGFATLLRDLAERDLLRETVIACLSEFGRTPTINRNEGRDHHASGWSVALAGGPLRGGLALGATGPDGQQVRERPVSAPDLLATLCQALGLNAAQERYTPEGRPVRTVDASGTPLRELFPA